MRHLAGAAMAALAVVLVVVALERSTPAATREAADGLRGSEPRSAAARAACADIVIEQLVEAFNVGDRDGLEQLLDPAAPGRAFSLDGPPRSWAETDASKAVARLVERHDAGERWRVGPASADEGPSWHGGIDVRVELVREAPDLPAGRVTAETSAVVSCVSGRIAALRIVSAST